MGLLLLIAMVAFTSTSTTAEVKKSAVEWTYTSCGSWSPWIIVEEDNGDGTTTYTYESVQACTDYDFSVVPPRSQVRYKYRYQ